MQFIESEEFKKDFKKLAKKYQTLSQDFAVVKKAIAATPKGNGAKHWRALRHTENDGVILKMRMMCRAIRGSEFRVVYFYDGSSVEVIFIELYYKGDKANEDKQRIEAFLKDRRNKKGSLGS